MLRDPVQVVREVVEILDRLGIAYLIGGSMASSALGFYRETNDVDFVVDLPEESIADFVAALQQDYYVDEETIRDAVASVSSFNIIHLPTMIKSDLFVRKRDVWWDEVWKRRVIVPLTGGDQSISVFLSSPEDTVLQKLLWYRMTGEMSERQWSDVQGVLKVQEPTLNIPYLRHWASYLQIDDLLEEALDEANIRENKE